MFYRNSHGTLETKFAALLTAFVFAVNFVVLPVPAMAQSQLDLPEPGSMLLSGENYAPATLRGVNINPDDPLKLQFIIDMGDSALKDKALENETLTLVTYFLTSVTVPEDELWVNLSPYEKDRIISDSFGKTEMGRDLLAQDYILKQLSASLLYPENDLGSKFWERVYAKAMDMYGTTKLPMNTFNKIWIVPKEAKVYEHEKGAYIVSSHLDIMLEEDYLALDNNMGSSKHGLGNVSKDELKPVTDVSLEIIRDLIIPEIEKEVNEGETFANLRQIYNSMILAVWYKKALKSSLLTEVYANNNKVDGIDLVDPEANNEIYDKYVAAFKQGAFDIIKEDYDPDSQQIVNRKYFSGGFGRMRESTVTPAPEAEARNAIRTRAQSNPFGSQVVDLSLTARSDMAAAAAPMTTPQMTTQFTATPRVVEALQRTTEPISMADLGRAQDQAARSGLRTSQVLSEDFGVQDAGLLQTIDELDVEVRTQAPNFVQQDMADRSMGQALSILTSRPEHASVLSDSISIGADLSRMRDQGQQVDMPVIAAEFRSAVSANRPLNRTRLQSAGLDSASIGKMNSLATTITSLPERQTLTESAIGRIQTTQAATPAQARLSDLSTSLGAELSTSTSQSGLDYDFDAVSFAVTEAVRTNNPPAVRTILNRMGISNPTVIQTATDLASTISSSSASIGTTPAKQTWVDTSLNEIQSAQIGSSTSQLLSEATEMGASLSQMREQGQQPSMTVVALGIRRAVDQRNTDLVGNAFRDAGINNGDLIRRGERLASQIMAITSSTPARQRLVDLTNRRIQTTQAMPRVQADVVSASSSLGSDLSRYSSEPGNNVDLSRVPVAISQAVEQDRPELVRQGFRDAGIQDNAIMNRAESLVRSITTAERTNPTALTTQTNIRNALSDLQRNLRSSQQAERNNNAQLVAQQLRGTGLSESLKPFAGGSTSSVNSAITEIARIEPRSAFEVAEMTRSAFGELTQGPSAPKVQAALAQRPGLTVADVARGFATEVRIGNETFMPDFGRAQTQPVLGVAPAAEFTSMMRNTINQSSTEDIIRTAELGRATQDQNALGGVDLNPNIMKLEIESSGKELIIPVSKENIENLNISGFTPVIINIAPAENVLPLVGLSS